MILKENAKELGVYVILCILAVLPIPIVSEIARLVLFTYVVGKSVTSVVRGKTTILENALVSVATTTSMLLALSLVTNPTGVIARLIISVFVLVLLGVGIYKKTFVSTNLVFNKTTLLIVVLAIAPLVIMFLLNPFYHLISDGWWHYSIYGLIETTSFPLANPWLADVSLAYPFAMHTFLAYIFGNGIVPVHIVFFVGMLISTVLIVLTVYTLACKVMSKKAAILAGLGSLYLSTIGGLFFLIDIIRLLPKGITYYTDYLFMHSGPHLWYGAMKILPLPNGRGLNLPLQSTTMVAFFGLVLLIGILYFIYIKKPLYAAILFIPLLATNPIYAVVAAICIGGTWLYDYKQKGVIWSILLAITTIGINIGYVKGLLSKEVISGVGFFGFFTANAWWMLVAFCIGYIPFIILSIRELRKKTTKKRWILFVLFFIIANLLVNFGITLGFLYTSTTLILVFIMCSAPYLASVTKKINFSNGIKYSILAITLISSLLIVATYSYYTVNLDQNELRASSWIQTHTNPGDVFLVYLGDLDTRILEVYVSTFGKRPVYIADIMSLTAYAEDFAQQQKVYDDVFLSGEICSLDQYSVNYIYVAQEDIAKGLSRFDCLEQVYLENGVGIYKV